MAAYVFQAIVDWLSLTHVPRTSSFDIDERGPRSYVAMYLTVFATLSRCTIFLIELLLIHAACVPSRLDR